MSNIEPTVTRTMRCTTCSVVGTHTINASMRNEAVLCPACAESGKRSVCVVVNPNEPTEEQKQAAREWIALDLDMRYGVDHVAMLLAEREAKLREDMERARRRGEAARHAARVERDRCAMSEPVIKATAHICMSCGLGSGTNSVYPWTHCSSCNVDTTALYGPDALVRVAEATAAAAGYHGARAKAHATRVVDRLTKGET